MSTNSQLAILGGTPAIPPDTLKSWPPITEVDEQYVLASLRGGSHAFGPNCVAFEKEFAARNDNRYAITTNSGTAALHMCVAACGCSEGDEVIVTAYSWSSSATCILHHNCIPVFVDIDFDTINMAVDKIEAAITLKTKAILVVHLHGLAVDMEKVMAIANKHGLKVIEDACQSHGARFQGKKVGTLGHCAAFSFNQNKNLCSGEGGMFVTDDEEYLSNDVHFVEIDLLRAGEPMPYTEHIAADYRIAIRRREHPLQMHLYPFSVRQPIPSFPLPLLPDDKEPHVDLGTLLQNVYDRARYRLVIDYSKPPEPRLRNRRVASCICTKN